MAINFSDEDKKKLVDLAPLYHYKILANMLEKQPGSVQEQARILGIKLIQDKNFWTPEEDEQLKELCNRHHRVEIADIMGKTYSSVSTRCGLLGLTPLKKPLERLSDWEKEQIKLLGTFHTISEIAAILHRPSGTITAYVRTNHIKVIPGVVISNESLIEKIRTLAKTMTTSGIAKELALSWQNVFHICKENGIVPLSDKNYWTPEQKETFKKLVDTHTYGEIAAEMNITVQQALDMARYLGVKAVKSHRNWTREELTFLKTCNNKSMADVLKVIHKPRQQIRLKAKYFGINILKEVNHWTAEEDKLLRELYEDYSTKEIATRMNRSISSIKGRVKALQLREAINKKTFSVSELMDLFEVTTRIVRKLWVSNGLKLYRYNHYQTVKVEDLTAFLKKNQNLWDATKMSVNIFGSEEQWLIDKKREDAVALKKSYYWTEEETALIIKLFHEGKSPEEMTEFVAKRVGAIRQRLKDNGCYYHPLFTEEEIAYIKENCKTMTSIEIAEVLKTRHEASIRNLMHDLDVYWEDDGHKQLAISLYKEGVPMSEIAKQVGRNIKSVATLLRETGYEVQSFTSWEPLEPLIIELYNQGKSIDEILEELPSGDRTRKSLSLKLFRMRKKGIID